MAIIAAMTIDLPVLLTFGLLALTVLLLWAPLPAGRRHRDWTWSAGLALASAPGYVSGILDWRAPLAIIAYAALAWGARAARQRWQRGVLLVLTGLGALLLALHRVPGFSNPVIAEAIRFSGDAPPFTLRANFDTAVAGIILVGVFCERIRTRAEWGAMLRRIAPVVLSTLVVVLGLGWALGHVRPDLERTPYPAWILAWFLAYNLLVTCVTEEAFFRGLLLERMASAMQGWRGGAALALSISSVLFGLAHLGGGPLLALLAAIAGLHYGLAYLVSKRIEGAILTHFALNAVHVVAFTYPALA